MLLPALAGRNRVRERGRPVLQSNRRNDRSRVTARSQARRLPAVLGLARVEAFLLVRSLLVLAGLPAGSAGLAGAEVPGRGRIPG